MFPKQCFLVCPPRKTLLRKQNLFPMCFQMFPAQETLFSRLGKFKKCCKAKHKQYFKIRAS